MKGFKFFLGLLLIHNSLFSQARTKELYQRGVELMLKECKCHVLAFLSDEVLQTENLLPPMKIYKKTDKSYMINYSGLWTECIRKDNRIELIVIMNRISKIISIDIEAGKFIGFSKKGESDLFFYQSKMPFEYN